MHGDKILADIVFLICEEVFLAGAELIMPPRKKGRSQMTSLQISRTKEIANRRIVVKQSKCRLKNFRFLQTEISIFCVNLVDGILIICCAMFNLVVPILN